MNVENTWYVYLIRTRLNTLYCGVSTNVAHRFHQHQCTKAGAKALKGKGPLQLAWQSNAMSKRRAMQIEYKIKQMPKYKKEQIILDSSMIIAELSV